MKDIFNMRRVLPLPLLLLFVLAASAQVQTPRYNTIINANTQGFYEYLPQGYDAAAATTYPLIVFLAGKGSLGNGDAATLPRVLNDGLAKLINDGKFPTSFTVNGSTQKFIVISPQFVAWQAPADVEAVINYAISHYKVNVSRVYLTGMSMGGGGVWDYAGDNSIYANRLAAVVTVCGSSYPELAKGRVMAAANLPIWATHNKGDDVVAVYKTNGYIDYVNQDPGPVPLAKKTIFDTISHDAWTKTYNPAFKEAGMNIYEWMLQYQRNVLTAGSNSPVCYDSVLHLSAWNIEGATYNWTGPNGFTSTQREPYITPVTAALAGTYTVMLLKGDSTATASTTVAVTAPGIFYRDADQDGYGNTALLVNACRAPRGYTARSGDCDDAKSTIYPGAPELCDGLDNDCNGLVDDGIVRTRYYLDKDKDGHGTASAFKDSCAQPAGYVTDNTDCNDNNATVYAGAIEIADGLDNDCNGKVDDSPVPCVKVNLYGGTNPYTNTQWNNWNVTASLNSGALKYVDATASSVTATLSGNYGMADNGTTYGSGMAPTEVLRYTTTANAKRTLAISGLTTSKTYNLELYASRNANSGYNTLFAIGSTSVTISTYRNLTSKAVFTNLVPNASGQVVVTITNPNAYSYLAGFMLTENVPTTATTIAQIYADVEKQTEILVTGTTNGQAANPALVSPFTMENNNLKLVPSSSWVSGFFPGILWNLYEYTGKALWADRARTATAKIEQEQYNAGSHDVGFKIYSSFGAGYRLTNDPAYRDVIIQAAKTLATRFNPTVGCIRSWDWNTSVWQYPVVIDNMMNLELLFAATRVTGDSTYYKIAVSHANTTLKNHFHPDFSSYHVVDYDSVTGAVRAQMTYQGYSDASAWARGQAWGLYGFTMCYRETGDRAYLEQAENIAAYLINHLKLPADKVPYWDFDAPNVPNEPRDASAAAIMASALYELLKFSPANVQTYRTAADNILKSLTEQYRSPAGQNGGFLLLHSTGSRPSNSDVDKPLIYADYYYLEALLRNRNITAALGEPANRAPVANAGNDQAVTLPANTVTLNGAGQDADGSIAAYAWCKVSGPDQFTCSSTTTTAPVLSNLVQGTYTFRLTVTDNAGAIASDDVTVTVNPVPVTTTKSIQVNLYGGTNPYNNTAWNNWNVNSSLKSAAFKYSDATASTITATLSKHTLADNGSRYGSGMAPAEVLRYTTYGSVARTLTFSGLSASKTYALELYASRANKGNATLFTINGSSITILTDSNKTNTAVFTKLTPTSAGQLVLSIKNLNTYNYLNGFVLREISSIAPAVTQLKAASVVVPVAGSLQVQAHPNPTSQYFILAIESNSEAPVQLRVVDAVGRVVELRRNLTANTSVSIGQRYPPGVYYGEVLQDGKTKMVKLLKQ